MVLLAALISWLRRYCGSRHRGWQYRRGAPAPGLHSPFTLWKTGAHGHPQNPQKPPIALSTVLRVPPLVFVEFSADGRCVSAGVGEKPSLSVGSDVPGGPFAGRTGCIVVKGLPTWLAVLFNPRGKCDDRGRSSRGGRIPARSSGEDAC